MSFLSDLTGGFVGGLAKTALLGYLLNQVTKSMASTGSTSKPDAQTRMQNNANPENRIPIVYGQATLGGIITDAVMASDNLTMYFCITICEKTGKVNLGTGADSTFTFKDIYIDDNRIVFNEDGVTLNHTVDRDGNVDKSFAGLIQVHCYAGNSSMPTKPSGYANFGLKLAKEVMPGWSDTHAMGNLVFAIVKMKYDTAKGLTKLGQFKFTIINSMNQPGDCLYDYMTNTIYGASIPAAEINI
jgi:hypothetical protein